MTVASTLNKKQYQGNNLTTEFPLPFHVTAKEHVFALLKKGTKIEEIKNNFAVDLERKVFIYPVQGEAIATGESLTIYRKIPLTQIVDLENAGAFHPEVLEHDGFDRIVMQIQQLDEEISRALKIDITDTRDTSSLLEELFAAREEAVSSAQKALEQAKIAAEKAEKTLAWAQFAEEKVKELTDLTVECYISNDGQGQVNYDKEAHRLEIVLPFDNSGSSQSKVVLTDSTDLARSDIGASAKAVHSLQAKMQAELANAQAELDTKLDKSSLSSALDSDSEENAATSKAVNELRKNVPFLSMPGDKYIDLDKQISGIDGTTWSGRFTAPENGYAFINGYVNGNAIHTYNSVSTLAIYEIDPVTEKELAGKRLGCSTDYNANTIINGLYMHVQKGHRYYFVMQNMLKHIARFYYAEGTI